MKKKKVSRVSQGYREYETLQRRSNVAMLNRQTGTNFGQFRVGY